MLVRSMSVSNVRLRARFHAKAVVRNAAYLIDEGATAKVVSRNHWWIVRYLLRKARSCIQTRLGLRLQEEAPAELRTHERSRGAEWASIVGRSSRAAA